MLAQRIMAGIVSLIFVLGGLVIEFIFCAIGDEVLQERLKQSKLIFVLSRLAMGNILLGLFLTILYILGSLTGV